MPRSSIDNRGKEIVEHAQRIAAAGLNWVQGNNAVFGPGGPYGILFPTLEDRTKFSKTEDFQKLHEILGKLPHPPVQDEKPIDDFSGKIVVRMPKSLHASLAKEAETEGVSLNQLILAKLSLHLKASV